MNIEQHLRDIRYTIHVLRTSFRLASERTASTHRVAVRWLLARQNVLYDRILRLQLLEGAAGVPFKTWFAKDLKGLQQAREHFERTGDITKMDPEWFSRADTGTFSRLQKILFGYYKREMASRKIEVPIDMMDIIHDGLFGVPLDPSKEYTNVVKLYSAGKEMRPKILGGSESPTQAVQGKGSMGFKQIIRSMINQTLKNRAIDPNVPGQPGILESVPTETLDPDDKWGMLAAWMIHPSDPVGKALRKTMRKSWEGWMGEEAMNQWLDTLVKTKKALGQKEMGEIVGVPRSTFHQSYWVPGWAKFSGELRKQTRLIEAIKDRFLGLGFTDVDFTKDTIPTERDINPKRFKGKRQQPRVSL